MRAFVVFLVGGLAFAAEVLLSGACERLLGNTNLTLATVLAAWMLGLAAGAAGYGRIGLRGERGLAAALALFGVSLPLVSRGLAALGGLRVADDTAIAWARSIPAAALVLLPAVAAGFAFPAMVSMVRSPGRVEGAAAGLVYSLETLGAACGSLLAGFYLYRSLGRNAALDLLAAVALGIAAVLWKTASRAAPVPESAPVDRSSADPVRRLPLVALALSGSAVLGLELLLTRWQLFFVPGLVSALAAVLAGIVLGTAIGAAVGAWLARRGHGLPTAATALMAAALGVAVTLAALPFTGRMVRLLPSPEMGGFDHGMEMVAALVAALWLSLLPTAASAVAFALVVANLGPRRDPSGVAYGWSSSGSALGVIATGIAAGGVVGSRGFAVVLGLVLLAAAALLLRSAGFGRRSIPALATGAVASAALLVAPRHHALIERSSLYLGIDARERRTLAVEEDRHGMASVVDLGAGRGKALYTNAFLAASTEKHYGYMRMLGHLPMLLSTSASDALLIAYGTGTTVGSLSRHDALRRLDLVEISEAVLRLAPHFREVNHGVPYEEDAPFDVRVTYADGREFLERDGDPYDVITLEPLPPNTPAAVHFYTREFYARAAQRLRPGGLLCQWIPIHISPPDDLKTMVRTFAVEFPTLWLFLFDQCALLLGSTDTAATVDVGALLSKARGEDVARDLWAANLEDAAAVLASFVAGREALLLATRDAAVMSDDRPLVALRLATPNRAMFEHIDAACAFFAAIRQPIDPWLRFDGLDEEARSAFRGRLAASQAAKAELLEYRRDRDPARLARALRAAPGDLEALAILGRKPPFSAAAPFDPTSDRERAERIAQALSSGSLLDVMEAIDAAADNPRVDPALLLPLLDHPREDVRMRSMVALHRRIGDIHPYDPSAGAAARKAAIKVLKDRLADAP